MSTNDKLAPGMVLGRYELLLPIAQGGMATVWAARQKGSRGFQKTVAIKTMLPTLSDDAQFEQMFLDEASLAARIHHPNVAEILDLGEQDDIIYLVMEWIDGEALSVIHKAIRKNNAQLPQRIALRIAVQACAGLHAAHELRDENDVLLELVHRDVSPQNVLVTYDGIVKLVDFGVAKAMNRAGGETSAGQLKGKVPYMSPEQARGGTVDRRTDIFAMGIVLYKLTTGLHPFLGENDLVTMRNIISRPLLPPRAKSPNYPVELEQVLIKCLQKDPDKRYETMYELGGALERALTSMGSSDDDVGGFLRTLLGDRGAKRRAALRDAVRAADERLGSGPYSSNSIPPGSMPAPMVHERVSDIVLTQLAGAKEEMLPDRPSAMTDAPTSTGSLSATPTSQGPASLAGAPASRRGRSSIFIAVGIAMAAGFIGFALFRTGASQGHAAATASVHAAAIAALPAAPAAPPIVADIPAVAPVPVATADAAAPSATAATVNVDDLPTTDDKKKGVRPVATASASVPVKAPRGAPTWKVPEVQNPGF